MPIPVLWDRSTDFANKNWYIYALDRAEEENPENAKAQT